MAKNSFMWTDDEVELLLSVTLQYKCEKTEEGTDWETVHSKYPDILQVFLEKYPGEEEAARMGKEFPHPKDSMNKQIIITKLKAIRAKYRDAVNSGRKSGHGRVVLFFYELCHEIWGGSPATQSIEMGLESSDINAAVSDVVETSGQEDDTSEAEANVHQRRNLLQAKLKGYKHDKLKRRCPENNDEDMELKRRMVNLMEKTQSANMDCMNKISANIGQLTSSITEGFSLLRQAMPPPMQHPMRTHLRSPTIAHFPHTSYFQTPPTLHMQPHTPPHSTPSMSTGSHFSYVRSLNSDDIDLV
ncbi:uncharacterized protein LOC134446989 [Engraulis encrasicolus]|uniref:uncharacterized protein LOC134446989 n=1 Tax=Engraulis encrasicolus TaxID=184585 RepID=UPI002FD29ACA